MRVLWILSFIVARALGNTEIINFAATESRTFDLPFLSDWLSVGPETPNLQWNLTAHQFGTKIYNEHEPCTDLSQWDPIQNPEACPNEFWVVLDLGHENWKDYSKFTLRLSWPASYPVDVFMKIFDPSKIASLPVPARPAPPARHLKRASYTRQKLARIEVVDTGVLTPRPKQVNATSVTQLVPIMLTLEPLLLGVLPLSMVPVVFAIILVTIVGFLIARKIDAHLQTLATLAREEVSSKAIKSE